MKADRMTVTDAGRAFILFNQGKKAEPTISRYRSELNRLCSYHGDKLIKTMRPWHLDQIFNDMVGAVSAGCFNNTFNTYSVFFRWCRSRGYLDPSVYDMLEGHERLKTQKRIRDRIPVHKFPQLLETAQHPRDRMLIALGLFTFLRQGSIKLLRLRDIDLANGTLNVQVPKTNDADVMPISVELDRELRRWLTWYSQHHPEMKPDWFLIPRYTTKQGGKLRAYRTKRIPEPQANVNPEAPPVRLEQYVKPCLEAIGWATVDEMGNANHSGMHDLRRSGARALYDELVGMGYDGALQRVRSMLHHSTVAVTEGYLGLNIEREKRNKDLIGKAMFPSLVAENVVALDSEHGDTGSVGLRQVR